MNSCRIESAPLQGYTDYIFRNLHHQYFGGIENYYTPFIRYERKTFRNRDLRDCDPENNRVARLIPQLIASDPEELNGICTRLRDWGYRQLDINMGCPFVPIVRQGKGSGILPHPDKVERLLQETLKFPEISFSVKIRLGWESVEESLQLLPLFHSYPLRQITLHARTGKNQYKGEPDKEAFGLFYEKCRLPLLYNGDVQSVEEALAVRRQFPDITGITLGRGLLQNPFLAREIQSGPISLAERQQTISAFHQELLNSYQSRLAGDHQVLAKMKTFWEYFLPESNPKIRKKILKSQTIAQYKLYTSLLLADDLSGAEQN